MPIAKCEKCSLVKENNKRAGSDFLDELNLHVYETVQKCVKTWNGKRTLDRTVVQLVIGKIKT